MSLHESTTVLERATLDTITSSTIMSNPGHLGVHLVVRVFTAPTSGSITPSIVGLAPNGEYTILDGAAISTTGTTVLKVYPGITAAANVSANDVLPTAWKVNIDATGGLFNYSVTANLLK